MVKMTVSPTLGRGSLTDLVTDRSDCCGVTSAAEPLSAVSGSNWSRRGSLMVAAGRFVPRTTLATWAVRISTAPRAPATVPTVQTPVALSYVPWLGVSETKSSGRPAEQVG